jgi:hypothetical protein
LKKITSILLILLLFFDSCGYIFVYIELSNYFKKEGTRKISEYLPNDNLEIIIVHKSDIYNINSPIKFVKKQEIRYKDELYDICNEVSLGDSIYYYCLNDKNENILEQAFANYLEKNTQDNSQNVPIHNILKSIIKVATIPLMFDNKYYQSSIKLITQITNFFPQYSSDIPTPPPKIYS